MITVHWHGRLGNQLFEYALGRILAEELGYRLNCRSLEGFPATRDSVPGKEIYSQVTLTGQEIDLDFILKNKDKFGYFLNGWFQRYEYYQPHKEKVRSWYNRDIKKGPIVPTARDIVIHIRRTQSGPIDMKLSYVFEDGFLNICGHKVKFQPGLGYGPGTVVQAGEDILPFEFYSNILDGESFDQLFIITDIPNDPFFKLFERYHPRIISGNIMDDFNILRSAVKTVMSISTFSWWTAFLSDATVIYMPDPIDYSIWGPKFKVKLIVNDEPRYKVVKVKRDGGTFF